MLAVVNYLIHANPVTGPYGSASKVYTNPAMDRYYSRFFDRKYSTIAKLKSF
jgi:hypothetical protein